MNFLVSIHRPDGYDGSLESPDMGRAIDDLNEDMSEAGVRVVAMGLRPPSEARSLRATPSGEINESIGLYLQGTEHVGGFWILDCQDIEEALDWGRKAVQACRANVEVRPFY
jgi:hypothetical protein